MLKKKFALVLCMALTVSALIPGCGKKSAESALPTDSVIESQTGTVPSTTSSSSQSAPSPAPADSAAESVPELAPVEFERGRIEGHDYISPALNFRLSLGENFQFYDEEMLANLNTAVSNMSDNSAVGDALDAGAVIIDMAAIAQTESITVNVTYESSSPFRDAGVASVKDFAEKSVENIRQSMEAMGATNMEIHAVPVDIAGLDSYGMTVACDMNGMRAFEKLILIERNGILGTVTVSGLSEESVDGVIQGISGLG